MDDMMARKKAFCPQIFEPDIPRYKQIKQILSDKISRGELTSGCSIPSENELAQAFHVHKNTIVRALIDLKNMGVLNGVQGKGTFVSSQSEKLATHRLVGLLMRTTGHVFGSVCHHLAHNLQKEGYHPVLIDPRAYQNLEEGAKQFFSLLESQPAGIIADGAVDFPFQWLLGGQKGFKNIIFIHRFEYEKNFFNASYVLSDYGYGGYLAIKHFLELGHKKVALYTYPYMHKPSYLPDNPIHRQLMEGCHTAMEEEGMNPGNLEILFSAYPGNTNFGYENLEKSLTSPDRPTAIFTFGDSRAKDVFQIARKLGLRIPNDLAVVGYWNTPWVEAFEVPLSSISIREEELAKITTKFVVNKVSESEKNGKIYVKPELIIRNSSGDKSRCAGR